MRPTLLVKILAPVSLAAVLAVGGAILATRKRFRGFVYFLIPLVPSMGLLSLYIPLVFLDRTAASRPVLIEAGKALRLVMGISWVFFSHNHHRLNSPSDPGLRGLPAALAVTILNLALYAAALVFPPLRRLQAPISAILVSATLFYAGVSAFTVFRFTNRLEISTWAGIAAAGFSLVYFPLVALAEVFDVPYPLFSDEIPPVMQVHPYYIMILCAVISAGLLAARGRAKDRVSRGNQERFSVLTPREREIFDLLLEGHSLQAISDKYFLSLSTVKTHLGKIYGKLGVSGRHEAAAQYRGGGSAPFAPPGERRAR